MDVVKSSEALNFRLAFVMAVFISITLIVATKLFKAAQKDSEMLDKLIPFIQETEGGLSRDPADTASSYPAPWSYDGKRGWHTNKGITYKTFVGNAQKLGYAATADNFFTMPDHIWLSILKGSYMAAFPLEQINHLPRIQAVIITWAWGSGTSGANTRLARFQREEMGVSDSDISPAEIVDNFNSRINSFNEREWFLRLCNRREADFRKMPTCHKHCKGWIKRLNVFRKLFY